MANKVKLVLTLEVDTRDHAEKISAALSDLLSSLTESDSIRLHMLISQFDVKFESGRINS